MWWWVFIPTSNGNSYDFRKIESSTLKLLVLMSYSYYSLKGGQSKGEWVLLKEKRLKIGVG